MQNKFVLVKRDLYECSICMEKISIHGHVSAIWTCYRGCRSIFHLECLRAWGIATIGHSLQFSCPNCRCSSYNLSADVNGSPRCYCGKKEIPLVKKKVSSASLSCGAPCDAIRANCRHPCPLQCHPGPCPPCSLMGPPETCVTGPPHHLAKRQRRCGSAAEEWCCDDPCPRVHSNCVLNSHKCPSTKCHSKCEACPEFISISCECTSLTISPTIPCHQIFEILSSPPGKVSCQKPCKKPLSKEGGECTLICHPPSIKCTSKVAEEWCFYGPTHTHSVSCKCGKESLSLDVECVTITKTEIGYVRRSIDIKNTKCNHPCGKTFSSCLKHTCNQTCCTEEENHLRCTQICNKRLACGKSSHRCLERCHPERPTCRPCPRPSFPNGWICPCGATRIEGPLECSWTPPVCSSSCNRIRTVCGHSSLPHPCHSGKCPPCTMPIFPKCGCGRTVTYSVPCMFSGAVARCGLRCGKPYLDCSHTCTARCHPDVESCPPCSQQCQRKANKCGHPCSLICGTHPSDCVCKTTILLSCPCGLHKEEVLCFSASVSIPCTDECLSVQRSSALAEALNIPSLHTSAEHDAFSLHAAVLSWPMIMDIFSWARTHLDYLLAIEEIFFDHISSISRKRWVDLPPTGPIKRAMTIRIANNYHLQTIELDSLQKGSIRFGFPDEYPTTVPEVPKVLLSTIVTSISFYDLKAFLSNYNGQENSLSPRVPSDENILSTSGDLLHLSLVETNTPAFLPQVDEPSSGPADVSEDEGWIVISSTKRLNAN